MSIKSHLVLFLFLYVCIDKKVYGSKSNKGKKQDKQEEIASAPMPSEDMNKALYEKQKKFESDLKDENKALIARMKIEITSLTVKREELKKHVINLKSDNELETEKLIKTYKKEIENIQTEAEGLTEGLKANKEILEKVLIAVCAFFILVIGICSFCFRGKYMALHKKLTELQKSKPYFDISAELSVPMVAIRPKHIPRRGRSYECGTHDNVSVSPGRKFLSNFTTSTTYYCAPQQFTHQQELKRCTVSTSQPRPVLSLEKIGYKKPNSNPEKFNSTVCNSEIESCDYKSEAIVADDPDQA